MLEDMDVQLRSQLEKIIVQRNQLGAEKAARDIEARTCDHQHPQFFTLSFYVPVSTTGDPRHVHVCRPVDV